MSGTVSSSLARTLADDAGAAYALLTDGSTIEVRPARPGDAAAVRAMHDALSPDNLYLRFFSLSRGNSEREARRVCRDPGLDHAALLGWLNGELAGVASYEPTQDAGVAEIAFAVPDDLHRRGIATLLLEHLVSVARLRQVRSFTAETLQENSAMLRVFADAGLPVRRRLRDGVVELTFPLPATDGDEALDAYRGSVAARESQADVASLRHLLAPASVAVIGASRRPGTVGREILRNIVTGGFTGPVYPVNPQARSMEGLPCLSSAADLPAGVDLAVLAVPAVVVPRVAEQCGRSGVRSLIVVTAGLGPQAADLLAICRRYGMRLAGPGCFGITVPGAGLNATFGARPAASGTAGVVVQSGGIGISLLAHLTRLGVGVSSFASVGDKLDVSSNDLLTWWEQDGTTRLAILYVESFGSPRKFARTARRVGGQLPVLTVLGGRSAGQQAAGPAAVGPPEITQRALFAQAGVIVTGGLGELVGTAALLAGQPLPGGDRVAIVSNAGGAGVLAADACADNGLRSATLSAATRRSLRGLLPPGAALGGLVDTTATVSADAFRACLEQVAADEGVDAVLAVVVPTAVSSPVSALTAAVLAKPLAAAVLDQAADVELLRGQDTGPVGPAVPAYAFPEAAARALAHAAGYHAWRQRQQGRVPALAGVRAGDARRLVAACLAASPAGGWLPADTTRDLLSCYQIPLAAGGRVALDGGVEVLVGVVTEPVFGPLVVFGLGGVATDVPGDRTARLTPLTDQDAAEMIRDARAAPLLLGHRGAAAADTGALADVLLRVSRLADDLPEVAELDLNPVLARPDGAWAADARIRLSPGHPADPFLRRLR